jgi:hypothetical protein
MGGQDDLATNQWLVLDPESMPAGRRANDFAIYNGPTGQNCR